jgi:uncharacterized membrane protein
MTYNQIAYFHLATVFPAFIIGTFLIFMRKGSPLHKVLGRIFLISMLVTAGITLFMSAKVGPTLMGHFGFIHLISLLIFYSVPSAYIAARRGLISKHKTHMISIYCGGILIAGAFAFMPGRMLHDFLLAII